MKTDIDSSAVVYTCDSCWSKWFAGLVPRKLHDANVAIIHANHFDVFADAGFTAVNGIVEGTKTPGLFCPHLGEPR